jgi:hypothetical protein
MKEFLGDGGGNFLGLGTGTTADWSTEEVVAPKLDTGGSQRQTRASLSARECPDEACSGRTKGSKLEEASGQAGGGRPKCGEKVPRLEVVARGRLSVSLRSECCLGEFDFGRQRVRMDE